jgi:Hpt domain.
MNDHITKPVNPRQLATMLQHWLKAGKERETVYLPRQPDIDDNVLLLDLAKALQFADHDESKMRNRLVNFYSCYGTVPEQLDVMIARGDHEGLKRMAHTLKSAAGYIGAMRLQLAASQLWANKASIEQFATTLRQELQTVLIAIVSHITGQAEAHSLNNVPYDFSDTLEQIEVMIRTGDARASLELTELEDCFVNNSLALEFAAIRDAFEELDIALALSKLVALRATHLTNEGRTL